eukprot:1181440-Prorocentrum_minimum.AAC.4
MVTFGSALSGAQQPWECRQGLIDSRRLLADFTWHLVDTGLDLSVQATAGVTRGVWGLILRMAHAALTAVAGFALWVFTRPATLDYRPAGPKTTLRLGRSRWAVAAVTSWSFHGEDILADATSATLIALLAGWLTRWWVRSRILHTWAHQPADVSIGECIKRGAYRRSLRTPTVPRGVSSRWRAGLALVVFLCLAQPSDAFVTSHRHMSTLVWGNPLSALTTETMLPVFTMCALAGQAISIASLSVEVKIPAALTIKEQQRKQDPYRTPRHPLFDEPVLKSASTGFAPEYSRDTIPGFVFGNHPDLDPSDIPRISKMLKGNEGGFWRPDKPLPTYQGTHVPFTIPFADEQTPQYQSPRGFSAREEDLIKKENDKYLRIGIVEKAPLTCKHASNPVIAAKKDPTTGEWTDVRFCVDYRMVNKRSVRLNYRTLLPE